MERLDRRQSVPMATTATIHTLVRRMAITVLITLWAAYLLAQARGSTVGDMGITVTGDIMVMATTAMVTTVVDTDITVIPRLMAAAMATAIAITALPATVAAIIAVAMQVAASTATMPFMAAVAADFMATVDSTVVVDRMAVVIGN